MQTTKTSVSVLRFDGLKKAQKTLKYTGLAIAAGFDTKALQLCGLVLQTPSLTVAQGVLSSTIGASAMRWNNDFRCCAPLEGQLLSDCTAGLLGFVTQ